MAPFIRKWHFKPKCWSKTEMALGILVLASFHMLLQAQMPRGQILDFWALDTCNPKEQSKPEIRYRNTYFHVGCNGLMVCTYTNQSYCEERNSTRLKVYPSEKEFSNSTKKLISDSMTIQENTKCNITVRFLNMTIPFSGRHVCEDRDASSIPLCLRTFRVGGIPVLPKDIHVILHPAKEIILQFDPVKTGTALNDPSTTWNIGFTWHPNETQICSGKSDKQCKKLTAEGLCQSCIIRPKYDGTGQYSATGFIDNNITFSINVENKFGSVSVAKEFYLPDWIEPGPVRTVTVTRKGSSWLFIKVAAPKKFDQMHFTLIRNEDSKLSLYCTYEVMSSRDQSLLEDTDFFNKYEFVRNLEDDEAALNKTSLTTTPCFPQSHLWTSEKTNDSKNIAPQKLNVSGLPFPGFYYNMSFSLRAHFWSPPDHLTVITDEAAPAEAPKLHDSFAYCPSTNGPCATCVVYFREIPRLKRGGIIKNYTLSLTLLNASNIYGADSCWNATQFVETAGGKDNTFLVPNLVVGGLYRVSLQAANSKGLSPPAIKIFQVHSSPVSAPTDIIIETAEDSYDMTWTMAEEAVGEEPTYFAHFCYTLPLQLDGAEEAVSSNYSEAAYPLNCVVNMKTKAVSENKTRLYTFSPVTSHMGLTPAFFLSVTSTDGNSSGLFSADCFYAKGTVPEKIMSIDVQKLDDDSTALRIKFRPPCGKNLKYAFGRPKGYVVGVVKDVGQCKERCPALMQKNERGFGEITSVKNEAVHIQRDLQPGTSYCVGVNLAAEYGTFHPRSWHCDTATTGKILPDLTLGPGKIVLLSLGIIIAVIVFPILIWIYKRCCKQYKGKFDLHLADQISPSQDKEMTSPLLRNSDEFNITISGLDGFFPPRQNIDPDSCHTSPLFSRLSTEDESIIGVKKESESIENPAFCGNGQTSRGKLLEDDNLSCPTSGTHFKEEQSGLCAEQKSLRGSSEESSHSNSCLEQMEASDNSEPELAPSQQPIGRYPVLNKFTNEQFHEETTEDESSDEEDDEDDYDENGHEDDEDVDDDTDKEDGESEVEEGGETELINSESVEKIQSVSVAVVGLSQENKLSSHISPALNISEILFAGRKWSSVNPELTVSQPVAKSKDFGGLRAQDSGSWAQDSRLDEVIVDMEESSEKSSEDFSCLELPEIPGTVITACHNITSGISQVNEQSEKGNISEMQDDKNLQVASSADVNITICSSDETRGKIEPLTMERILMAANLGTRQIDTKIVQDKSLPFSKLQNVANAEADSKKTALADFVDSASDRDSMYLAESGFESESARETDMDAESSAENDHFALEPSKNQHNSQTNTPETKLLLAAAGEGGMMAVSRLHAEGGKQVSSHSGEMNTNTVDEIRKMPQQNITKESPSQSEWLSMPQPEEKMQLRLQPGQIQSYASVQDEAELRHSEQNCISKDVSDSCCVDGLPNDLVTEVHTNSNLVANADLPEHEKTSFDAQDSSAGLSEVLNNHALLLPEAENFVKLSVPLILLRTRKRSLYCKVTQDGESAV